MDSSFEADFSPRSSNLNSTSKFPRKVKKLIDVFEQIGTQDCISNLDRIKSRSFGSLPKKSSLVYSIYDAVDENVLTRLDVIEKKGIRLNAEVMKKEQIDSSAQICYQNEIITLLTQIGEIESDGNWYVKEKKLKCLKIVQGMNFILVKKGEVKKKNNVVMESVINWKKEEVITSSNNAVDSDEERLKKQASSKVGLLKNMFEEKCKENKHIMNEKNENLKQFKKQYKTRELMTSPKYIPYSDYVKQHSKVEEENEGKASIEEKMQIYKAFRYNPKKGILEEEIHFGDLIKDDGFKSSSKKEVEENKVKVVTAHKKIDQNSNEDVSGYYSTDEKSRSVENESETEPNYNSDFNSISNRTDSTKSSESLPDERNEHSFSTEEVDFPENFSAIMKEFDVNIEMDEELKERSSEILNHHQLDGTVPESPYPQGFNALLSEDSNSENDDAPSNGFYEVKQEEEYEDYSYSEGDDDSDSVRQLNNSVILEEIDGDGSNRSVGRNSSSYSVVDENEQKAFFVNGNDESRVKRDSGLSEDYFSASDCGLDHSKEREKMYNV